MVSLLAFTSCASEYKIEGSSSVSRLDGKMLFVKVPSGDRMLSIDSAEVIHGMFKMEGITDSTSCLLSLKKGKYPSVSIMPVL